ncbi:MAG: 50S ribosomal protein L31 [Chloroflexi bacterium]|jgi:large subunit ribosomal protein L31|nr:50S ribosomal protein L31 [Chloroflexota bacterium]
MKADIHPKYYPEAQVSCACGNAWTTGSTLPEIRVDVCSACHPFFTGQQQRLVDRAGQVDRFNRRFQVAQELRAEQTTRETERRKRAEARRLVEIVDEQDVEPLATGADTGEE